MEAEIIGQAAEQPPEGYRLRREALSWGSTATIVALVASLSFLLNLFIVRFVEPNVLSQAKIDEIYRESAATNIRLDNLTRKMELLSDKVMAIDTRYAVIDGKLTYISQKIDEHISKGK